MKCHPKSRIGNLQGFRRLSGRGACSCPKLPAALARAADGVGLARLALARGRVGRSRSLRAGRLGVAGSSRTPRNADVSPVRRTATSPKPLRPETPRPQDTIRASRRFFPHEVPTPFNPVKSGIQSLILSIPYAVLQSEKFVKDWGFMNFSRWVILGAFLGFVLPLFTLSYATAAFGTERESRSLVWLMTRPIPRSGIYLAKFLGTLPWCVLFGLGGFAALCLAGGEFGRKAFALYWPAAALANRRVFGAVPPDRSNLPPPGRRRAGVRVLLRGAGRQSAGKLEATESHLLRTLPDV